MWRDVYWALMGGGTKTVCVLADSDGKVIGHGIGGTTNPNLVSAPEIKETLQRRFWRLYLTTLNFR